MVESDSYEAGYADGLEKGEEKLKKHDHRCRYLLEGSLWGPSSAAKTYPAPWDNLLLGVAALVKEHERLEWMVERMRDSERMLAQGEWEARERGDRQGEAEGRGH